MICDSSARKGKKELHTAWQTAVHDTCLVKAELAVRYIGGNVPFSTSFLLYVFIRTVTVPQDLD